MPDVYYFHSLLSTLCRLLYYVCEFPDICMANYMLVIFYVFFPQPNDFFAYQLKAFQVWLVRGLESRRPPEQLPIVLQVSNVLHYYGVTNKKASVLTSKCRVNLRLRIPCIHQLFNVLY